MTTTVPKGTNRRAAAARTTKAAQRGPLPAKAAPASAPAAKTTSKPTRTATGDLPADYPGAAKATALCGAARAAGWTVTATTEGRDVIRLTFTSAVGTITVSFLANRTGMPGTISLVRPERKPVSLRNASAVRQWITSHPAERSAPARRTRSRRAA